MLPNSQANFIYLAGALPDFYPVFFEKLTNVLLDHNIPFALLPHTKDVWCRDYMPVQTGENEFVQFVYNPDYLQTKQYFKTISDVDAICEAIHIIPQKSPVNLDGGNLTLIGDRLLLCDKILKENPAFTPEQLTAHLCEFLKVKYVHFIPTHETDVLAHSDGWLRGITDNEAFMYAYETNLLASESSTKRSMEDILKTNNVSIRKITGGWWHKDKWDATGEYLNFLEIEQCVIMPVFGVQEDTKALKTLQGCFDKPVYTVMSNDIAKDGGIIHCATWATRE